MPILFSDEQLEKQLIPAPGETERRYSQAAYFISLLCWLSSRTRFDSIRQSSAVPWCVKEYLPFSQVTTLGVNRSRTDFDKTKSEFWSKKSK